MTTEELVQKFWVKVQDEYSDLVREGGVAESKDYYIFQTKYKHSPDLMIVGINPGGDTAEGNCWICPKDDMNMYLSGEHQWFQTLRNIFGYPKNQILNPFLENCVGSNKVFINTGNVKKIPNSNVLGPKLIRELVSDILQPKHIVALGNDVFASLSNKKPQSTNFGQVKLVHSFRDNIPICLVYNPSRQNSRYFNRVELLDDWQRALEWFLLKD
jgi:uracil-DNA glycosylase